MGRIVREIKEPLIKGESLPTRSLLYERIRFTKRGVEVAARHLARFGDDIANKYMLQRLSAIVDGKLEATDYDLIFYTHELREYVRFRHRSVPDYEDTDYSFYVKEHSATLQDYGIPYDKNAKFRLYHPSAVEAAGEEF